MKKISTLALALIAMGSLSMPASAQVNFEPVSTPTLESGWYQMRQVVGVTRTDISATAPRYVYSAETAKDGKYYFASDAAQKSDATAFVYVDNTDGKYAIKSINGKWGDFVAISSNTKPATYDITQMDTNNPTQYRVGTSSYWEDWSNWNYIAGSRNSGNARFEFSKVNPADNYDVYSVVATGDFNPKTMQITVTNTLDSNKGTKTVYNGGSFFFTKGTTVTQDNFTITEKGTTGLSKTVKIDATAKRLVVEYTLDDKENKYAALLASSKADIAKTGVGLPKAESKVRTTFDAAISAFESEQTYEKYVTLSSAYTAYLASSDIQMPEDGKAYTFTAVFYDGAKRYMNYAESGYSLVPTSDETNANYPETAKLICRKVGENKFTFVNNDGKHFVWKGGMDGANSNKGYVDTYNAEYAVTVAKIVKGGYVVDIENEGLLGYVGVMGYRKPSGKNPEQDYFIFTVNGSTYSYNQANAPFYKTSGGDKHSSLIKIEETTYPNTVTFNAVSDVEGVSNLATFSAPFATVIPEGVKAYYVSTADNTKATMKAVEGEAIPANEGVLLTSESAEAVTMVPATDETLATIENNKLGNSAGADKTIAEGDNAYILANGANGTAFYKGKIGSTLKANKAYLTLDVVGGEAISMNFGGNVTGINQIVNAEQNNAPVYDLTGRRVVRTVKGGLYIKGGNKFIAR
ncbi:MAG: hypothetical protein ACM674_00190 [Bacteroidales bacterium]